MFIDEDGSEKRFSWRSRYGISQRSGHVPSAISWEIRFNAREMEITDEGGHFSLKEDLVEHVWASWGCVPEP